MPITSPLVLPADLVLAPVAELAEEMRARLGCEPGDFAVTRPGSRTPSRVVDAVAAELLQRFASPCTIVEAVVAHAQTHGEDAERTLEEAFPLLQGLWRAGFLVEAGTAAEARLVPTLAPGARWGGWEVTACVQVVEDTELFQLRQGSDYAALKIVRPAAAPVAAPRLRREAALLARLAAGGGAPAPRLLACGGFGAAAGDGGGPAAGAGARGFLVLEWCEGVDAALAAAELREEGPGARGELLRLCRAVAGAYARLHRCGALHGDVHPRNVLVAAGGAVRLIDFDFGAKGAKGAAGTRPAEGMPLPARGGVGFFFEPEYALAVRAGEAPPPASAAGEQYAVAALLHLLVTGAHYLDFALGREEMMRQIAEQPPASWEARGIDAWPELEAILARALAKAPAARFDSVAALAEALDAVAATPGGAATAGGGGGAGGAAKALLERTLESLRPEAPLYTQGLPAPRASVALGAAGIAAALYRMALAREDAALLALADLWAVRACADGGAHGSPGSPGSHAAEAAEAAGGAEAAGPAETTGAAAGAAAGGGAFYSPVLGVTPATVGRISLYHCAAGPPAVQALVAHAMGETAARQAALAGFAAAVDAAIDLPLGRLGAAGSAAGPGGLTGIDLALGRGGLLLGTALLLDTTAGETAERDTLSALGEKLAAELWRTLEVLPPIAAAERPDLGMAHGWAGYLYAVLRWRRAAGGALPAGFAARLAELAACGERWGRGMRWRWFGAEEGGGWPALSMPGWCNGSAGFVYLWTAAHELLADPLYRELALGAAWNAWEQPEGGGTLCCGLAGRAYALLHLYRHYRFHPDAGLRHFEPAGLPWLARARRLAERAAEEIVHATEPAHSLHRGALGVAALAAELAAPDGAAMPLFAAEGWNDLPAAG
jgi:hypothetical protein